MSAPIEVAENETGVVRVFAIDLPDDRDRRQLTTRLRRHGVRVLYSVFTIHIGDAHLDRLLAASAERFTGGGHLLADAPVQAPTFLSHFGDPAVSLLSSSVKLPATIASS